MSEYYETMPKKVRIGFSTFEVKTMSEDMGQIANLCGASQGIKQEIIIAEGMNAQQTANTFLHEVIHMIHFVYGLMHRENASEEEYTNLTANGLCAFWQDNPEAIQWMTETLSQ